MGDRTTVTLTVLRSQADKAREIFEHGQNVDIDFELNGVEYVDFTFNGVNYGDLDRGTKWLTKLIENGIAFDSQWDAGSEYGPGVETARFTEEGGVERKEVSDSFVNPSLEQLMALIDDHAKLKEYIQNHFVEVTPLSWDNQEEYGKLYRARQLITT